MRPAARRASSRSCEHKWQGPGSRREPGPCDLGLRRLVAADVYEHLTHAVAGLHPLILHATRRRDARADGGYADAHADASPEPATMRTPVPRGRIGRERG